MAIFNVLYLTSTVVIYTKHSVSPSLNLYYKDEVTALIMKGAVIFIAIITELLVAIQTLKGHSHFSMANRRSKCFHIVLLWNMFVFVQIWVGLALLPAWTGSSSSVYSH